MSQNSFSAVDRIYGSEAVPALYLQKHYAVSEIALLTGIALVLAMGGGLLSWQRGVLLDLR